MSIILGIIKTNKAKNETLHNNNQVFTANNLLNKIGQALLLMTLFTYLLICPIYFMQNKTPKKLTVTQIETMNKHELMHLYLQIMQADSGKTPQKIPRSQTSIKRTICYKLQELRHGKLKPKYQTMIDKYCANPILLTGKKPAITYNIAAGQMLTKRYKVATHTALKTPEGFAYNSKTYSSLSAIANYITGQKVSGCRFFNLRHRSGKCGQQNRTIINTKNKTTYN